MVDYERGEDEEREMRLFHSMFVLSLYYRRSKSRAGPCNSAASTTEFHAFCVF